MKPTFLVGKGRDKDQIETSGTVEHYRRIYRGLLKWEGLPDDAPYNYPMDCLFYTGGCGCKKMRGFGPVLSGITPSTLTVYGQPYDWTPRPIGMPVDLGNEYFNATNDPCMYLGRSVIEMIRPYTDILERTLKVLNTNVSALMQPVIIKGLPGAELPAMVMRSELFDVPLTIPTIGMQYSNTEVLDLKAQDHTQNLISTIDWCDARILELMMSSNGVEKASGITTLETVSGVQSIIQEYEDLIERCRDFADRVNDRYRLNITVSEGEGMRALFGKGHAEQGQEVADDADGADDE